MSRVEVYLPPDVSLDDLLALLAVHLKPTTVVSMEEMSMIDSSYSSHILVAVRDDAMEEVDPVGGQSMRLAAYDALWNQCASVHPLLAQIPVTRDLLETDEQLGEYQLRRTLHEGQTGAVYECVHLQSEAVPLAIKCFRKEQLLTFGALRSVNDEIKILSRLKHVHIVELVDVFTTPRYVALVTSKGEQDLFAFLENFPAGVTEERARTIVACLVQSVYYCHSRLIAHRDIKPENILLDYNFERETCDSLLLCDFGIAVEYRADAELRDFCGSPGFFAPEMVTRGTYPPAQADIWSVGAIVLELLLGHDHFSQVWMPAYRFEALQEKAVFGAEVEAALARVPPLLASFSGELRDFVQRTLCLEPAGRLSLYELLRHPWVAPLVPRTRPSLHIPPHSADATADGVCSTAQRRNSRGLIDPLPSIDSHDRNNTGLNSPDGSLGDSSSPPKSEQGSARRDLQRQSSNRSQLDDESSPTPKHQRRPSREHITVISGHPHERPFRLDDTGEGSGRPAVVKRSVSSSGVPTGTPTINSSVVDNSKNSPLKLPSIDSKRG